MTRLVKKELRAIRGLLKLPRVQVRREVRLQSVFVLELPATKHAGERGRFPAEPEMGVHRGFPRVDLAADPARKNGFPARKNGFPAGVT